MTIDGRTLEDFLTDMAVDGKANSMAILWTERQVAQVFGFSIKTLQKWRTKGEGPGWYKIGHSIRYHPKELAAFIEASRCNSSMGAGA